MRILFDQGTPVPLHKLLNSHQVETVFERGWSTLTNGESLATAEEKGFDVFVTTDKNLRSQQNIAGRESLSSYFPPPVGLVFERQQ